jgi:hypothetical protein
MNMVAARVEMTDENEMLSLTDAAKESGKDASTLRRAAIKGVLRAQKVGNAAWIVRRADLRQWLRDEDAHKPGWEKGKPRK